MTSTTPTTPHRRAVPVGSKVLTWPIVIGGVATSVLAAPLRTGRSAASLQRAGV